MNNPFEKIERHLNRKKPKPGCGSDKPVRPKINIHYHTEDKEYDEQYVTMNVDYNFYSMTIVHRPYKLNPYAVQYRGVGNLWKSQAGAGDKVLG